MTELQEQIKDAMKARDKVRLAILRQVHGELKDIEINERRETTEEDVSNMIKRVIKQTSETLEASIKAANNQERTDTLTRQVEILKSLSNSLEDGCCFRHIWPSRPRA